MFPLAASGGWPVSIGDVWAALRATHTSPILTLAKRRRRRVPR